MICLLYANICWQIYNRNRLHLLLQTLKQLIIILVRQRKHYLSPSFSNSRKHVLLFTKLKNKNFWTKCDFFISKIYFVFNNARILNTILIIKYFECHIYHKKALLNQVYQIVEKFYNAIQGVFNFVDIL